MKILFDECVDQKLIREFPDLDIQTVKKRGWAEQQNGNLLRLAEREFDVFITTDQNIPDQQNLAKLDLAVLVLSAGFNTAKDLKRLVPQIYEHLKNPYKGKAVLITIII